MQPFGLTACIFSTTPSFKSGISVFVLIPDGCGLCAAGAFDNVLVSLPRDVDGVAAHAAEGGEDSLVKSVRFGFGFESYFGKSVQNSVEYLAKFG